MGWFDEDDDDDGEEENAQVAAAAVGSNTTSKSDEVDPLDAFMSGIHAQVAEQETSSSSSFRKSQKTKRLDWDNEEEATSHWKQPNASSSTNLRMGSDEDDKNDTTTLSSKRSRRDGDAPPNPMSRLFVEAQGAAAAAASTSSREVHDDEDDDDDENDDTDRKRQRRQADKDFGKLPSIALPTVEISQQYDHFRKVFRPEFEEESDRSCQWRQEHNVSLTPLLVSLEPVWSFEELSDLPSCQKLTESLRKQGYRHPTVVQSQTLAATLAGQDVMVTASTGSGKTLAYALTLAIHCASQPPPQAQEGPIGLVLVPTRELATQVTKVVRKLLHATCDENAKVVSIMGGMGTYQLTKELRQGCHVVVSTPGRLLDLLSGSKPATNLYRVTLVVLDEADKLLDMGFERQVSSILQGVPRTHYQRLFFSATFGRKLQSVAQRWFSRGGRGGKRESETNFVRIAVGPTGASSEHVDQHVVVLPQRNRNAKKEWMTQHVPTMVPLGRMIVFVATRADCEDVAQHLRRSCSTGLTVDTIHGDRHQSDRNAALAAFRSGQVTILVATDVAARGLDIPHVAVVLNYDAAKNFDSHVHRIGRAGRLMRQKKRESKQRETSADEEHEKQHEHDRGVAYTLLTSPKDADFANLLFQSFHREGRSVSDELVQLAQQSRHFGGGSHARNNKSGLGFHQGNENDTEETATVPDGVVTFQGEEHRQKQSRWG